MTCSPLLDHSTFRSVVHHTPLVSMDLLVTDADGNMLVGHRTNSPAQGYWFVPGGRIRKSETREQAFRRISLAELGHEFSLADAGFNGVYEHFYDEDFTGETGPGTHYVVLAYELKIDISALDLPQEQHDGYRWINPADGLADISIHPNTQAYFPLSK